MPNHKTCDCHGDASQNASHTIRTMARSASTVVSGRVTNDTAKALASYCSTHDCTQSEALRKALVILSADNADPAKQLAAVAAALGLEADATADQIQQAIAALITNLPDAGPPGAAEFPDAVPPPPGTAMTSKLDKALAANGFSRTDLAKALRPLPGDPRTRLSASKPQSVSQIRADRELAAKLKARGMTHAQFEAFKAKAVKTTR